MGRNNAFFYGCPSENPLNKLFVNVANQLNKNIDIDSCTFRFEESKKTTARIILKKMIPDCLVYTFEASFNGNSMELGNKYFTEGDYIDLGRDIVISIFFTLCWKLETATQPPIKKESNKKEQNLDIQPSPLQQKVYFLSKSQKEYFSRYLESYSAQQILSERMIERNLSTGGSESEEIQDIGCSLIEITDYNQ